MNVQSNFASIEQMVKQIGNTQNQSTGTKLSPLKTSGTFSFQEVLDKTKDGSLNETIGALKFSKHANQRLESRNIDLSLNQLSRLENGTQKAREKGINESLVMVDNLAFIVNVKNNTVVTAVNDEGDGVFTNIDGAVIS